jgi:hypothetical protein
MKRVKHIPTVAEKLAQGTNLYYVYMSNPKDPNLIKGWDGYCAKYPQLAQSIIDIKDK